MHDDKCFLVKGLSNFPGSFPKRPEISIPEVFHKDETVIWIVADQPWHWNIDVMEKCCDVGIVFIFYTIRVVMDQGWPNLFDSISGVKKSDPNLFPPREIILLRWTLKAPEPLAQN